MANITFNGTKLPQVEVEETFDEIFANWGTVANADVNIKEGHKSGAVVYEQTTTVVQEPYSSGEVLATNTNGLQADRSPVSLTQVMYDGRIDHSTLLDTKYERSMKAGTLNRISSEFDNYTVQSMTPAIFQDMESAIWNGATAAKKTLVAAMTAGAGQGSISTSAQAAVAAMPTRLFDSFPAIILNNNSLSKPTLPGANGIGGYFKVLGAITNVTVANIAAEYDKIYQTLDNRLVMSGVADEKPVIYAPISDLKLMRTANNSVGAASNKNFEIEGADSNLKAYYNGIEIIFKPLVGFRIAVPKKFMLLLMDRAGDLNSLETGQVANGAQQQWYKLAATVATWVTNQRYIVVHGG